MRAAGPGRGTLLVVDYIEENAPDREPGADTTAQPDPVPAPVEAVDPLLASLLTEDRNLRRRIVGALLRAVLADRRVT